MTKKVNVSLTPVKTIVIGVLTTVLGTLIVTKIINSPQRAMKSATIEAWTTLNRFENISLENIYLAFCKDDLEEQVEDIIYEKDQLIKSYQILRAKQNIDENLLSFIDRAIARVSDQKRLFEQYLQDYRTVKNDASLYDFEKKLRQDSIGEQYSKKIEASLARNDNAIKTIYQYLVDKYGKRNFSSPDEPVIINEDDVIGKWKEFGLDKTFEIKRNGRFTMIAEGKSFPGDWKLEDKTLTMTFDDKSGSMSMFFTLKRNGFLRYKMNEETSERQVCRQ